MSLDPETFSVVKEPGVAGLAGAIIALRFSPGASWGTRLFNLASGCLLAAYLAPPVAEWFGLDGPNLLAGVAVVIGIFGLNLADAVMQAIAKFDFSTLIPWGKK